MLVVTKALKLKNCAGATKFKKQLEQNQTTALL